jgi:hypothetical protein
MPPETPALRRTDTMSRLLKMPPQLIRLVLLTIGIVCVYFTARYFLTPPSFGQYGHYRGAALREIASRQPYWAGKAACAICHPAHAEKLAKGEHKNLSCETCHGPGQAHVANPAEKLPKLDMSLCVRCHEASPSKPKWLHQINVHNHYTGSLCTECHVPHQPNEVP